jgi:4-diphosphocytidyl-2-C-methyl-D-erythritol kinase
MDFFLVLVVLIRCWRKIVTVIIGIAARPNRDEIPILPRSFATVRDLCPVLANDLEAVTISRYPVIREIKERLLRGGASGALMSGSGPTVFGVFETEFAARSCADTIASDSDWFSVAAKTL